MQRTESLNLQWLSNFVIVLWPNVSFQVASVTQTFWQRTTDGSRAILTRAQLSTRAWDDRPIAPTLGSWRHSGGNCSLLWPWSTTWRTLVVIYRFSCSDAVAKSLSSLLEVKLWEHLHSNCIIFVLNSNRHFGKRTRSFISELESLPRTYSAWGLRMGSLQVHEATNSAGYPSECAVCIDQANIRLCSIDPPLMLWSSFASGIT